MHLQPDAIPTKCPWRESDFVHLEQMLRETYELTEQNQAMSLGLYTPLKDNEISLITIQPGERVSSARCDLEIASLSVHIQYETLF